MDEKLIDICATREKVTVVYPTRSVCDCGVEAVENLFIEKELVVTFNEKRLTTLRKEGDKPSYIVLDFGKELHGGIRMVVPSVSGKDKMARLRLTFGESVAETFSSVGEKGATNDHSPRDFEVCVPRYSTLDFGQTGFRFVKIELVEEGHISFKNIVAVSKMQDIPQQGYIKTNDELINKIFDTAIYTCYLNAQSGVLWDGIKRDRLVWSGDLNSEILTFLYTAGNIPHIKNSLAILRKTTPKNVWMNNIPSYSAWWVLNLYDYAFISGDLDFFNENLDYANEILAMLDDSVTDEGDMHFEDVAKATNMVYYLDWMSFETPDAPIGTASLILHIAQKLKNGTLKGLDEGRLESLVRKLDKYKTMPVNMKQTHAIQVLCGGAKENSVAFIEKEGSKGFSTFMSYFLFKALYESGSKNCIELIKEYYGGMLSRGATTFWEDFDVSWLEGSSRIDELPKDGEKDIHGDYGAYCYKGFRHSLCHGWSSGVIAFMIEKMVGLQVVEAGYKKIRLTPDLMGLQYFEAKIPTPMGIIEIICDKNGVKTTLPEGIELVV